MLNQVRTWNVLTQKKRKRTQKNGKRIKCKYSGNRPKIFGNPSTLFSFWGISDNSWKKKETDPNSLLGPFPCWGVSIAPTFQPRKFQFLTTVFRGFIFYAHENIYLTDKNILILFNFALMSDRTNVLLH